MISLKPSLFFLIILLLSLLASCYSLLPTVQMPNYSTQQINNATKNVCVMKTFCVKMYVF